MTDLADQLLEWYRKHGRHDLPWQKDQDPYRIWVSEIMLQQTQVKTVIPYYERFVEHFPDIGTLATATQDEVLHYWSGLGYYSRARNLHAAAGIIVREHGGAFPEDFETVLSLPGIGRSTAGAILSFAFAQQHSILDGNVKRVLARYHGIDGWPGKSVVQHELWQRAEEHTPAARVRKYNQAIMDLGASVCARSKPACPLCPLSETCAGYVSGTPESFPGRRQKKEKPVRKSWLVIVRGDDDSVLLMRRPPTGIWGGLWGFPEADENVSIPEWMREEHGLDITLLSSGKPFRHSFTHFHLDITPVLARLADNETSVRETSGPGTWYNTASPPRLGLAAPTTRLLKLLATGDTLL